MRNTPSIIGAEERPIAVVGMRKVGKTTLINGLAPELKIGVIKDMDELFQQVHGGMASFANNEQQFRQAEAALIDHELQSPGIFEIGSGAVESARVMEILRERAFTIWISAPAHLIYERMMREDSPINTHCELYRAIIEAVLQRNPLYAKAANVIVSARRSTEEQVSQILRAYRGDGELAKSA